MCLSLLPNHYDKFMLWYAERNAFGLKVSLSFVAAMIHASDTTSKMNIIPSVV